MNGNCVSFAYEPNHALPGFARAASRIVFAFLQKPSSSAEEWK